MKPNRPQTVAGRWTGAGPTNPIPERGRSLPGRPRTEQLEIAFNRERVKVWYNLIDARTAHEAAADRDRGSLKGPVLVFLTGHAQRPVDAYPFTTRLAHLSRSGIVMAPVCDTPFGIEPSWRGDAGKDMILMEAVRHVLLKRDIQVTPSPSPENAMAVSGEGERAVHPGRITAGLAAVGWSHGAILARRLCHAHAGAFSALAQVCPAGYARRDLGPLLMAFTRESLGISRGILRGQARDILRAGWGITRGLWGDGARSIRAALNHRQPAKLIRLLLDLRDCTAYCDDMTLAVEHLGHVTVIFGYGDTCMDVAIQAGVTNVNAPSDEELQSFWNRFFPGNLSAGSRLVLRILPGSHLAPLTHCDTWARGVLEGLEQLIDAR